jgi:hypothetical protein
MLNESMINEIANVTISYLKMMETQIINEIN